MGIGILPDASIFYGISLTYADMTSSEEEINSIYDFLNNDDEDFKTLFRNKCRHCVIGWDKFRVYVCIEESLFQTTTSKRILDGNLGDSPIVWREQLKKAVIFFQDEIKKSTAVDLDIEDRFDWHLVARIESL